MTRNKRTSEELFQEIDGCPLTSAEALEMLQTNISYEEVKVRSAERARINRLAEKVEGTPLAEWPPFDVVWQLDPAQFYFVFDGAEPGSVRPDKLRMLNDVPIAKIDSVLTPYWHRRADEVWSVGDARKAARVIVHWSEGRAMTPAIVAPTEDHSQLVIPGGNHRLAVARAGGIVRVPVLYRVEHEKPVLKLLGV
jgi:hypothetical protein